MTNTEIAKRLTDHARLLEARGDNLYRVRAYRRGAEEILGLEPSVEHVLETAGRSGLEALPGIGRHLAYTIDGLVRTGEFRTWEDDHPRRVTPGPRGRLTA